MKEKEKKKKRGTDVFGQRGRVWRVSIAPKNASLIQNRDGRGKGRARLTNGTTVVRRSHGIAVFTLLTTDALGIE